VPKVNTLQNIKLSNKEHRGYIFYTKFYELNHKHNVISYISDMEEWGNLFRN